MKASIWSATADSPNTVCADMGGLLECCTDVGGPFAHHGVEVFIVVDIEHVGMVWGEVRHVIGDGDEASTTGLVGADDLDGASVVPERYAGVGRGVGGSINLVDDPNSFDVPVVCYEHGAVSLGGFSCWVGRIPPRYPASFPFGGEETDGIGSGDWEFELAGHLASHGHVGSPFLAIPEDSPLIRERIDGRVGR